MKKILIFIKSISIFFTLFSTSMHASEKTNTLYNLAAKQCTPNTIINKLLSEISNKQIMISKNSDSTLDNMINIASTAKNPNKTIGEQLSKNKLEKLSELSQRSQSMNMALLIESDYERDILAISELIKLSNDYYKLNKVPEKKDNNMVYFSFLKAWEKTISKDTTKETYYQGCTLDYSLYSLEINPIIKLSSNDKIKLSQKRIAQILNKHNIKYIDFSKLSGHEKKEIVKIYNNIVIPAMKTSLYIQDINNIRLFAKISKIIHDTRMNDLLYSGGNINNVDSTINKILKSKNTDQSDKIMIAYWQMLDKKIPSFMSKNIQAISNRINKKK